MLSIFKLIRMRFGVSLITMVTALACGCTDDASVGPVTKRFVPEYLGNDVYPQFEEWFGIGDTLAIDSGLILSVGDTPFDTIYDTHKLYLTLQTTQWYAFYNQYVLERVQVSAGKIMLDIVGVQFPGKLFEDAFKQSNVTEYFQIERGTYEIEIRYRHDTSRFQLRVTDTTFHISKQSGTGIELSWDLFWRYRPKTMVFVCGHLTADSNVCQEMLDSLLITAPLQEYFYPDSGMRPYPSSIPGSYIDWIARYFRYNTESDFERAGEALHAYGQAYWESSPANQAYLVNYRGKRYMSWYP